MVVILQYYKTTEKYDMVLILNNMNINNMNFKIIIPQKLVIEIKKSKAI